MKPPGWSLKCRRQIAALLPHLQTKVVAYNMRLLSDLYQLSSLYLSLSRLPLPQIIYTYSVVKGRGSKGRMYLEEC